MNSLLLLKERCENLIVVSDAVFSDGFRYDAGTEAYIEILGKICAGLAKRADCVVEIVFGLPNALKCSGLPGCSGTRGNGEKCAMEESGRRRASCLVEEYGGKVPRDLDALVSLPGVGRKTANVIRGNIFHEPSVVVDTHVKRISRKLGLTKEEDPVKIEYDLMKELPEDHWILYNIQIITFGRQICFARNPKCEECFLTRYCKEYKKR